MQLQRGSCLCTTVCEWTKRHTINSKLGTHKCRDVEVRECTGAHVAPRDPAISAVHRTVGLLREARPAGHHGGHVRHQSESARVRGPGACSGGSSPRHVGDRDCTTHRMHERPARARWLSDAQLPTGAPGRSSDLMGPISTQRSPARSISFSRMIWVRQSCKRARPGH
jgi:hypothetical protein